MLLLKAGEWCALYINDKIVAQGKFGRYTWLLRSVADALSMTFEEREVADKRGFFWRVRCKLKE